MSDNARKPVPSRSRRSGMDRKQLSRRRSTGLLCDGFRSLGSGSVTSRAICDKLGAAKSYGLLESVIPSDCAVIGSTSAR